MRRHLRVHVVPLWRERDRVVGPIEDDRPDRVYLLEHEDRAVERPDYHETVVERIADVVGEPPAVEYVDLFDMYDVMGAITTIADWHPDDLVRVNVTAGTKRAAVGATMACMDEHTDAEPYVADPESRPHGLEDPATEGYAESALLTTYQIDSPTPDQVATLAVIEAHDTGAKRAKKKTLITEAARYDLDFMRGRVEGDPENYDPTNGDYNVLDNRVTGALEHQGYVAVVEHGTRRYLELTEEGRQTLRAFRHRAESVIADLESRTADPNEGVDFTLDNPVDDLATDHADRRPSGD
ncbi:HFX_2341 family transcriptional regulator domain-containing protein [Halarchaeum sp. P4]|uniref:HFX_2341 family transcriptional regulator domain-containing protein n=1 Tax=Halarchaeum sp. P4 TaxID=3421639 RepID=UPI003EB7AD41